MTPGGASRHRVDIIAKLTSCAPAALRASDPLQSTLVLLPDFALIALGAAVARLLADDVWRGLDRLSYFVLYPALIFGAASGRGIDPGAVLALGGAAAAVVTAGLLLGLATRRLGPERDVDFGGALQTAFRFNTALGFVAVGALPPEALAALAIVVGCAIPLANVYAVAGLARGTGLSPARVAREIATNPFLLASLAGLGVAVSGVALPVPVTAFVDRLADAALPLVLLSVGAALAAGAARSGARSLLPSDPFALAIHGIRLVALPALTWVAITVAGVRGVPAATLLTFAALPTATAAHVLAARYGADRAAVARLVLQSSLLGLVTLAFWVALAVRIAAAG